MQRLICTGISTVAAIVCLTFRADAESFSAPIGLELESVSGPLHKDMTGTLTKVHNWGFTNVELVGDYNLSPEALMAELGSQHLKATSAHFTYAAFRDHPEHIADIASALNLPMVGCPSIPQRDALDEQGCRAAIDVFNRAGQVLSKRGIKFFYHPHGYEFKPFGDGTLFDLLVKETHPQDVHFQMDVYWIVHAGLDPIKLLQRYPDRWVSLHLKDMRKGAPTGVFNGIVNRKDFVPIGEGQIDVVGIMRVANKLGVKSYFIEDESSAPESGIPISLRYLNSTSWK